MPSGLDGNPKPIETAARDAVLAAVATEVLKLDAPRVLVAIDGRSGAGKSTLADELGTRVAAGGRAVVRSTTDSFHRPRSERMRLGPTSPDGYYLDSHQLEVIAEELLEPFRAGAPRVLVAAFDEPSDAPTADHAHVDESAVLIFDGLFLQRPEFEQYWNVVVFLEADRRADERWLEFLLANLPNEPVTRAGAIDGRLSLARWPRYRHGWMRYAEAARPADRAGIVIDNNDLAEPILLRLP